MTEIICFGVGVIVGGLLVGLAAWGLLWMVAHPGCLVEFEEWAERRMTEKHRKKELPWVKNQI